jgi:uncharacterized protein
VVFAVYLFGIIFAVPVVNLFLTMLEASNKFRYQYETIYQITLHFLVLLTFVFIWRKTRTYLLFYLNIKIFYKFWTYGLILVGFTINLLFSHILESIPFRAAPFVTTINDMHYFIYFLIVVLFVPIAEEIIFRGLLFNFLSQRFNLWTGLIISSVAFGYIHNESHFFSVTIHGIVYALLFRKTNSLIPAIICHFLWNLYAFFL